MKSIHSLFRLLIAVLASTGNLSAQSEVMAWGNLIGIRVDGQLMEFETSLSLVGEDWHSHTATGKERQRPRYDREGETQTIQTGIAGIQFSEVVLENGRGSVVVTIDVKATKDTLVEGVFFCVELPGKYYANGMLHFLNASPAGRSKINLTGITGDTYYKPIKVRSKGLIAESPLRKLELQFNADAVVYVRKEPGIAGTRLYIALTGRKIAKGQQTRKTITIKAGGSIDNAPVEIVLDTKKPGARFEGLGGNFRLQNPKADPQVIRYCIDNMRVAWGRVEMPWQLWHPNENINPLEAAGSGNLHQHVRESMEIARELTRKGIPLIISDWSAPNWAILGDPDDAFRNRSRGIYGYQLNSTKMEKIFKSIADYLVYLKQNYGVEPLLFSFNESDLGINVRHTGKEHAAFIKGLGEHFASRGIATKMMLGDNSDATTLDFILPAMHDPGTHKYIGAVSFHSWRGCDDATLKKWADAARELNLPLIIAEGSTDAAAWTYPEIFYEQSFALYEINLYTRLCYFCQPLSILQWQLTSDYSVLAGDGIYQTEGPLRPTQRFWNLKQLASTPEGAFAIPLSCNKENVNCAAFGNIARGEYAVHLVNNGALCQAVLKGLPADITTIEVYVTDQVKGMEKSGEISVIGGTASFTLHPASFTTLICK